MHYLSGTSELTVNSTLCQISSIRSVDVILKLIDMLAKHTDWFMKVIDANWMDRINIDIWKGNTRLSLQT